MGTKRIGLFIAMLLLGCRPPCKEQTVLLSFTLDPKAQSATELDIDVSIGAATKSQMVRLPPKTQHGTLEIDFPGHYPRSQRIIVRTVARGPDGVLGVGDASTQLSGSCGTLFVAITSGALVQRGAACGPGNVCEAGNCVDGICCDQRCDGQCQACDLPGSVGTCTMLAAGSMPHGGRAACAGQGTLCAGSCDGTNALACAYPAQGTNCGAACDGTCDGAGQCSSKTGGTCADGYTCAAGGCLTSCVSDSQCQQNFACSGGRCVRVPESDCLDGIDNNGDGLADCQDPTCTAEVTCVTAVPNASQLGVLNPGDCPNGYANPVKQLTNINPVCSGCSCFSLLSCSADVNFAPAACGQGPATVHTTQTGQTPAMLSSCDPVATGSFQSAFISNVKVVSRSCTAGDTATPNPTFDSTNFCAAARTSATCADAQHVCAPRPPSATAVCARTEGVGSCPAGFPSQSAKTYYAGFKVTGACQPCSTCTPGNSASCLPGARVYNDWGCSQSYSVLGTACHTFSSVVGAPAIKVEFGADNDHDCSADQPTAPIETIGPATICCLP
jgi:hypothetical protein